MKRTGYIILITIISIALLAGCTPRNVPQPAPAQPTPTPTPAMGNEPMGGMPEYHIQMRYPSSTLQAIK